MSRVGGSIRLLVVAFAAAVCLLPGRAGADASPWSDTEQAQVRLVSAVSGVGQSASLSLGLHFRLKKGWKIYWRSPGDAGFPPAAEWAGSQNLGAANVTWPAPERFSVLGLETVGYKDEVVLPLRVALVEPGRPLVLRGHLNFLACDDICIPYDTALALDIGAAPAEPAAEAHLIGRFQASVPGDGHDQGLTLAGVAIEERRGGQVLRLAARLSMEVEGGFSHPDAFIEGPSDIVFGAPQVRLAEGGRLALLDIPVDGLKNAAQLTAEALTVTLVDGRRAAEWSVRPAEAWPSVLSELADTELPTLALILGLAVLGGLILNLMPCVLPVLSIKLLSVVSHGGGKRRTVRRGFLASAAGIMAAFLILAAVLAALKSAGMAVGWGIQFQHPGFLIAMTAVVVLFAANLWEFFDIPLPRAVTAVAAARSGSSHLAQHFMSGGFVTLLATPCSAPFLGTAVGFALARGTVEIVVVFAALGLGLALPYLAVAAVPGMATRLPRPGPWMVWLRRILGGTLAGTGVWLLTVIATQAGGVTAGAVGAAMIAMLVILAAARRKPKGQRRWAAAAVSGLALLALGAPAWLGAAPGDHVRRSLGGVWQPFDEAAISRLVASRQTVFVDVTADWCLTCQLNKAAVLERGQVYDRLAGPGVVAMQADWTRPDAAIARFLAHFGRYGIPFNVVYGPLAPQGIALPELLSAADVLTSLDKAGAGIGPTAAR